MFHFLNFSNREIRPESVDESSIAGGNLGIQMGSDQFLAK